MKNLGEESARRGTDKLTAVSSRQPEPAVAVLSLKLVLDTNVVVSGDLKPAGLERTALIFALPPPAVPRPGGYDAAPPRNKRRKPL